MLTLKFKEKGTNFNQAIPQLTQKNTRQKKETGDWQKPVH